MSALDDLYNINFDLREQQEVSGQNKLAWVTVASGQRGLLTQITDKTQLYDQGDMGNEYLLYCDQSVDIKPNQVAVIGGVKYGVQYTGVFEDREDGTETHKESILSKRKI